MSEAPRNEIARAFARGFRHGRGSEEATPQPSSGGTPKSPRLLWIGGIFALLIAIGFAVQPSVPETAEKTAAGYHCLSRWDGSHEQLVAQVKKALNDPRSFEHVSTQVTGLKSDGTHGLIMKYRARNGFGSTVVENIAATYRNIDCSLVSWQVY